MKSRSDWLVLGGAMVGGVVLLGLHLLYSFLLDRAMGHPRYYGQHITEYLLWTQGLPGVCLGAVSVEAGLKWRARQASEAGWVACAGGGLLAVWLGAELAWRLSTLGWFVLMASAARAPSAWALHLAARYLFLALTSSFGLQWCLLLIGFGLWLQRARPAFPGSRRHAGS